MKTLPVAKIKTFIVGMEPLKDLKETTYVSVESNRLPACVTYRPPALSWGFLDWIYKSTYYGTIKESEIQLSRLYFSHDHMRDIVQVQRNYDEHFWRHVNLREDDKVGRRICLKRLAMTEEEMVDELIKQQIIILTLSQERRLGLLKKIFRNLNCPNDVCKPMFEIRYLSNLRPDLVGHIDHTSCRICVLIIQWHIKACF
jgi:hypothetical protein